MKQVRATMAVVGSVCCLSMYAVFATEIQIADDHTAVLEELGQPFGQFKSGSTEVWLYHQGTIELLYGKVVSVDFLSPSDLRLREGARGRLDREKRDQRQIARARGESEKQRILRDPRYPKLSAEGLMRVWGAFQLRFPDIPVEQPAYDAAITKLKEMAKSSTESMKSVEDPGPPPVISGKRKRKLKRAGKWIWGNPVIAQSETP